jgi:hypothetical protein
VGIVLGCVFGLRLIAGRVAAAVEPVFGPAARKGNACPAGLAFLVAIAAAPGIYVILHQNSGKAGRTVSESEIDLSTKTEGEIMMYRPLPKRTR